MNGPQHYAEAERLTAAARADFREANPDAPTAYLLAMERARVAMDAAQVHATLALAAAVALPTLAEFAEIESDVIAWADVTKPEAG